MKAMLLFLTLGITLIASGCNSNAEKKSGSDSAEQTSPMPSRPDRY